jgi:hypothetical protein
LRDAYHHYVNVDAALTTEFLDEISDYEGREKSWQLERLHNLCPACFDIDSAGGEDKTVMVTLDGNMQHTRFRDRSAFEFETLNPKLFVDYGRRQFDLAGPRKTAYEECLPDTACGNRFKATNGWNRAEAKTTTKRNLDESGLVATTCYHGTNLRFLNIYGGGERHSHAIRLLESIIDEVPDSEVKMCYDVACVFESALHRYKPEWKEKLTARIGRFHLYGHEHSCHVLYNLLRTDGYGLMIGEEPEHLWFILLHLIRSGRVSSGPRRTQKIDTCGTHGLQLPHTIRY